VFVVTGLTARISMSSESSELSESRSETFSGAGPSCLGGDFGLSRKLSVSRRLRPMIFSLSHLLDGVCGEFSFRRLIAAGVRILTTPGDLRRLSEGLGRGGFTNWLGGVPIFIFNFVIVFFFLSFLCFFFSSAFADLMISFGVPVAGLSLMKDL